MIINTLQDNIAFPLYKSALYTFEKISICSNALFSLIREEGNVCKVFILHNFYLQKLYSIGSNAVESIVKKRFTPSNQLDNQAIELPNSGLENLQSNNRAWIQVHSLFRKNYPCFNISNEALLDLIFGKDFDSKGVLQFAKKFSAHRENSSLSQSLSNWEKAYKELQIIRKSKNESQEIEKISRELFQKVQGLTGREGRVVLLFEKECDHANSPLCNYLKNGINQIRSTHDGLYQTLYSSVKEKLQQYLDTSWKKKVFSEIQEEVRALLLDQYSTLHQESTLGHNIPIPIQKLLADSIGLAPEGKQSLPEVIWDLFLQNGIKEAPNQPISVEKLNEIFEKEFEMITRGIEFLAMAGINQFIENTGKDLQSLLQLWHSKLAQKERGWIEIVHQSPERRQINLYGRDRANPIGNITQHGESSPMKMYSYNDIPKSMLETEFFFGLLYGGEGEDRAISSLENMKQFLSQYGTPTESYVPSSRSKVSNQGLLDHLKVYYSQENGSSIIEAPEKTFFEMRLHAFINYCKPVQNSDNVTDGTLSNIESGISLVMEHANQLYDAEQLSDEEYIAIIATILDIEESVIKKQHSLRAEVQSSEVIVPAIIKEQLRNAFSLISLSRIDIENIKSFAKVLLGSDMREEIDLLCKELPITNNKESGFTPPYVPLLQVMKDLCLDIKNLRTSPIALFRVYADVHKLLNNSRSIITLLSYIPYISILLGCTNPAAALTCIALTTLSIGIVAITPQFKPLWDIYTSIINFHGEIYTFIVTRLVLRAIQVADVALHCSETAPIQIARSFLKENISSRLSFSLHTPIDPQQSIPSEVAPLQRFHPDMEIRLDKQNAREISHISFPELSMEFTVREQNSVKRAYALGQPGFWIADVITDSTLENMDFAHVILENQRGEKKICIVPRSQERLLLQTILKMASSYSRKSIDLLSHYLQDQMAKRKGLVYYYDFVDGKLTSEDFDATSYLITHYLASGDTIRSQELVEQVKQMKANGRLENPNAVIKTLEQISSILPTSINSQTTKIILQLSSLCTEIPMQSKAFPLFLRAYQCYIASKESNHRSYLSDAEESSLLHHLKDKDTKDQILGAVGKLFLTTQTVLPQTLLLLANNVIEGFSNSTLFGKEGYIPTSLRKHDLQRKYLEGDSNQISLLISLMINNLINPYFSLGRDIINLKDTLNKEEVNVFDILPTILSKLNTESSTPKSDYVLLLSIIMGFGLGLLLYETPTVESMKKGVPLLSAIPSLSRDLFAAFLANPSNAYNLEEKFSGAAQTLLATFLQGPSIDYGIGKTSITPYTRHIVRGGVKTIEDYLEIHSKYKKQQLLRDDYARTFSHLRIGNDYDSLQTLEQNILHGYKKISDTFLQRENSHSGTNSELDIQRGSSLDNQIAQIANWYENGRARASNRFSYALRSGQNREDFIERLNQIYETLQEHTLQQEQTIQQLLACPPQNLPVLATRVGHYTQELTHNSTIIDLIREETHNSYSNQSTIRKIGILALRYTNTLLEVPTFGRLQIFKNSTVQLLAQEQSNLLKESKLIKSKRGQLFHSMITAFKPQTSLGLKEVYAYFCQGKDTAIIESLGLDDNQWEIFKEQLYRYMILQKHLACAEHITRLSTDANRTIEEKIDVIGHELDSISASLESLPALEVSVRSQLQLERKLGRSISPDFRNRLSEIVNSSIESFQFVSQFCCSQ